MIGNNLIFKINQFFLKGSERTVKAKKNIAASLIIKGASMIISFILIPLTLGYLNSYEYGVWLTLSSFMQWIDFFDIGLGNGLRNKLSESLAENNIHKARVYVSTTFIALFAIVILVYSIFLIINCGIDWYSLLNVSSDLVDNLKGIIILVVGMMCLNFVLKTIVYVYYAKQISMMNNLISFLIQAFSLIAIVVLKMTTSGALWKVGVVYSITPVLILLLSYPITFSIKYKNLAPNYKLFQKKYLKELIGIGFEFFLLKIGALLTFATSNIILSRSVSPEAVTPYSIALKYYSVITILYSIVTTPMWSASTEAYVKHDFNWLKKSATSMLKVWGYLSVICIIMIIISEQVYDLWIGNKVTISYTLTSTMAIYAIFVNLSTCYSTFLFGLGKVRMQLFSTFIPGFLFIIFSPIMAKHLGVEGMALALALANVPSMILNPIQFNILLSPRKFNSIWYK